jgi:hypothetical protein
MTLLRRAPREVYRVYSEDEFFAETTPHAEHVDAASPGSTERQLQRLAGATVLLVTVGVVGGMIVVSSVSSPASRRRGGARSSTASGSQPPAGDRIARMQASAGMPDGTGRSVDRGGTAPHVGGRKRQAGWRRRSLTKPPHRVAPRGGVTQTVSVQDPAQVVLSVEAGTPVNVAEPTTGASVASPKPVQIEFGFER